MRTGRIDFLLQHPHWGKLWTASPFSTLMQQSNCHGTTLFCLGAYDFYRPVYVHSVVMNKFLELNCHHDEQGSILARRDMDHYEPNDTNLTHTAVILNYDIVEQDGHKGFFVKRSLEDELSMHRVFTYTERYEMISKDLRWLPDAIQEYERKKAEQLRRKSA